jgi:adenylate kinase family enzyme
VWRRADTVVWIDLPRCVVTYQVITRTLRRATRREELWNGNRERWRNIWAWDPEESVIRWSWTQHARYRRLYESAMASPANGHLRFVRLRSRAEAERWLEECRRSSGHDEW